MDTSTICKNILPSTVQQPGMGGCDAPWLSGDPFTTCGRQKSAIGGMPHALILEPNERLLETLGKLFHALGYRTTLAASWAGAASRTQGQRFGLAVVDLDLLIRGDRCLIRGIQYPAQGLRVIITSAWCRCEVQGLMVAGWGDAWLFKPFGLEELTACLGRVGLPAACRRSASEGEPARPHPAPGRVRRNLAALQGPEKEPIGVHDQTRSDQQPSCRGGRLPHGE